MHELPMRKPKPPTILTMGHLCKMQLARMHLLAPLLLKELMQPFRARRLETLAGAQDPGTSEQPAGHHLASRCAGPSPM